MTTSTSGRPIWGSDRATRAAARAAGWSRADLQWERLMEGACGAWSAGQGARAALLFRTARLLARARFARDDRRHATVSANLGLIALSRGQGARGRRHLERALRAWDRAAPDLERLRTAPRSRSSMFHLRMEARHRETFQANLALRMGRFAAETRETITLRLAGKPTPHRHLTRWRGEKPPYFDDTRWFLAACLLIVES